MTNDISTINNEKLPLTYLDHNVLNLLIKVPENEFKTKLKTKAQIVYSEETLKEIKRSTGHENEFYDILEFLNAIYIELQLTDKFRITDKINLFQVSPREVVKYKKENDDNLSTDLIKSAQQLAFKFFGGMKGTSFDTIIDNKEIEMHRLLDKATSDASDFQEEFDTLITDFKGQLKQNYTDAMNGLKDSLRNNIPNQDFFRGPKEYRHIIQLGPRILNNIEPPNVLQQIWEKYLEIPEFAKSGISLEKFMLISENYIHPGEELTIYEKVTNIYNFLNFIGYYPDTCMEKENRFVAATSDTTHAAMGIFCKVTITMDERFAMKTRAIYEYLGIGNQVFLIEQKKNTD